MGNLSKLTKQKMDELDIHPLYPDTHKEDMEKMFDLDYDMGSKLRAAMEKQREAFIKEMLIKKGYPELAELSERVRFPKLCRVIAHGWEYIFADNGTKQGDFIVAISSYEYDNKFDFSELHERKASCQITSSFKWQDTNFDVVRL